MPSRRGARFNGVDSMAEQDGYAQMVMSGAILLELASASYGNVYLKDWCYSV